MSVNEGEARPIFRKTTDAGRTGTFVGSIPMGEVLYALVEFDDGSQDIVARGYLEVV